MSSEWRTPQGEAQLTGAVVYRCATCGADIEDGLAVFMDDHGLLPPGYLNRPLPPTTKTYHLTHLPLTEDPENHGS